MVRKAPLRYLGGQWNNAKWITSQMPAKIENYLEPFCGGASVFFHREKTGGHEQINDLNYETYNFWSSLAWADGMLLREIQLLQVNGLDFYSHTRRIPDVALAARTYRDSCILFRGSGDRWHSGISASRLERFRKADHGYLLKYSQRLLGVSISNSNAFDVILDADESTFLFLDPPYPMSARAGKDGRHKDASKCLSRMQYKHEFDDEDHKRLLSLVVERGGSCMICSYRNELYDEVLLSASWTVKEKSLRTNARTSNILALYCSPGLKTD